MHEPLAAARQVHRRIEALVLLLVHERRAYLRAERVAVAAGRSAWRPRPPASRTASSSRRSTRCWSRARRGRRSVSPVTQVLHVQRVLAVAGAVGGVGEQASRPGSPRTSATAMNAWPSASAFTSSSTCSGASGARRATAVDRVLAAFLGARVVEKVSLAVRHGQIGLLDARRASRRRASPKRARGRHHRVGVGVLGLEVARSPRDRICRAARSSRPGASRRAAWWGAGDARRPAA